MSRRPPAWYAIGDEYGLTGGRQLLGVVRYEGDQDTWDRLLADFLRCYDVTLEAGAGIEDPQLGWYRFNPDATRYYTWLLTEVEGPGRGNWQGAKIVWRPA